MNPNITDKIAGRATYIAVAYYKGDKDPKVLLEREVKVPETLIEEVNEENVDLKDAITVNVYKKELSGVATRQVEVV